MDRKGIQKLIQRLKEEEGEVRCVYEAGPCGYELYRKLRKASIHCDVIAPSLTPRKPGDRVTSWSLSRSTSLSRGTVAVGGTVRGRSRRARMSAR